MMKTQSVIVICLISIIFSCGLQTPKKGENAKQAIKPVSQYSLYDQKYCSELPKDSVLIPLINRSQYIIHGRILEDQARTIDALTIDAFSLFVRVDENIKGVIYADTINVYFPQIFREIGVEGKIVVNKRPTKDLRNDFKEFSSWRMNILKKGKDLILFLKDEPKCNPDHKNKKFNCVVPVDTNYSVMEFSEQKVICIKRILGK